MFSTIYQISSKIGAVYRHELPFSTVDEFVKVNGTCRLRTICKIMLKKKRELMSLVELIDSF